MIGKPKLALPLAKEALNEYDQHRAAAPEGAKIRNP
jgi:hypothetical protein